MGEAWKEIAPKAISMIEFVMDIRKGEWTDQEIDTKMMDIQNKMAEIQAAKNNGNWFAKTVTSRTVEDIPGFVMKFRTLQEYVNSITLQEDTLRIYGQETKQENLNC